jgi:hypothetical protein
MARKMPEEFRAIGGIFHQDIHLDYPSIEALAEVAVAVATRRELVILKDYLDELLSGKYGGDELRAIWRKTGGELLFRNAKGRNAAEKPGVALFLRLMRAEIERRLADKSTRS